MYKRQCDIHSRERTKRILKANGAERVYGMDDILTSPVDGSGCNERFGLLGSNKSTEESVKLFPRECTELVLEVQKQILDKTGKHVEVMVYGDGAFKDLSLIHIYFLSCRYSALWNDCRYQCFCAGSFFGEPQSQDLSGLDVQKRSACL